MGPIVRVATGMTVRRIELKAGPHEARVDVTSDHTQAVARVGDQEFALTIERIGDGVFAVTSGARRRVVHYVGVGGRHLFHLDGQHFAFALGSAADRRSVAGHHHDFAAPRPGVVTRIFVEEGQVVQAGDPLFVVEAMKMENVVRAPSAGRVTRVTLAPGAQVEAGAIVVEVEDSAPPDPRPRAEGPAS